MTVQTCSKEEIERLSDAVMLWQVEAEKRQERIAELEGQVLRLKIGLEQLRGADVSPHVKNHIERVLDRFKRLKPQQQGEGRE